MVCVGVALSIKTVTVALLPVVLAALAAVWYTKGRKWGPILVGLAAAVVPVVAFEIYKAISLGNRYDDWWVSHLSSVRFQATGEGLDEPPRPLLAKIAEHFHILAGQTHVAAEWWLALFLALPITLVLTLVVARRAGLLTALARPLFVISCLAIYGLLYVAWWLAVTSTEKAWLRRFTIGLFAVVLAVTLLALLLARILRQVPELRRLPSLAAPVAALVSVVALAVVASASFQTTKRNAEAPSQADAVAELSGDVAALADSGAEFYGIGWWSAPVISLYSGVDVLDLGWVDYCDPEVLEVINAGDAYVIWDFYAENLGAPTPNAPGEVAYEETDVTTTSGTLWRITLPAGACN